MIHSITSFIDGALLKDAHPLQEHRASRSVACLLPSASDLSGWLQGCHGNGSVGRSWTVAENSIFLKLKTPVPLNEASPIRSVVFLATGILESILAWIYEIETIQSSVKKKVGLQEASKYPSGTAAKRAQWEWIFKAWPWLVGGGDHQTGRRVKAKPIEVKLSDFGHSKMVRDGYTYARSHVGIGKMFSGCGCCGLENGGCFAVVTFRCFVND